MITLAVEAAHLHRDKGFYKNVRTSLKPLPPATRKLVD